MKKFIRAILIGFLLSFSLTQIIGCVGSSSNSTLALRASELTPNVKLIPQVTVSNLEGEVFTLPEDFSSDFSIIAFGFEHAQQEAINTWAPELKEISRNNPSVKFYEIPVIDKSNAALRTVIRNGMRTGISDLEDRKRTMTLFVDKSAFIEALGVKNQGEVALILFDRTGKVLWETSGAKDLNKSAELHMELSKLGL